MIAEASRPSLLPREDLGTLPTTVIEPSRGWSSLGLRELWEYRELLGFLIWREIQGAYRQTALGTTWLFLRPVVNMALLSLVFGKLVQVPSDNVPYPLFSLAALLPWGFFSNAVLRASRSLVENMHVISKVYFPRLVIPIAGAASGLVDLAASFVVYFVAQLVYGLPIRIEALTLPLFMALALGFSLMVGLWLATFSVRYRDVSFAVNFLLQAFMYASPVIYPVSLIPPSLRFLYELNPMTGVIQGFRWALLGIGDPPGLTFLLSSVLVVFGVLTGAYFFRRTERTVVDIL
ncbi:MAG TPA: ABC transporter permease [Anaerolineales bacterium]|nr:ABC transporter permease [Anaerolineales bacterium]